MRINNEKRLAIFPIVQDLLECYLFKISTKSRIIYWTIIALSTILVISLPLIYVDVSVRASGYFKSSLERQIIYASTQGKVIFSSIKKGTKVLRGDTLLIIDTGTTKSQLLSLENQMNENILSISDLEILTGNNGSGLWQSVGKLITQKYKAELFSFEKLELIQSNKARKAKAEFERNRILYSGKTIAEVDYENSKYAYSIEKESLSRIRLQQISDWQSDLTERREKQIILEAEHEKLLEELDSRVITAPLKGEIIQSVDIQSGSKVFYNQEIATISPDDSLVAVCLVSPKDIGLLHENQDVRIQVDAFNHSEWGLLKGKIKRIPEDITLDNNSDAWFVIECSPQQEYLSLKNGFKGYLRKGMTFNAMIFISRRSLFNLLFDKADKWLNPNLKPMSR